MKISAPVTPRGTRDFGPLEMPKRNFIFDTIKSVFQSFGFQPLETPAMENLDVLTGKYGDEGDQLIFKILNSGDFLKNVEAEDLTNGAASVLPKISEKALRYDLTVPFARYVVKNRGELVFPFKRYQLQPVWRADKPQKGRYREFYQCDADVVGTDSLLCEAEILLMMDASLSKLGIKDFTIKINNRKILSGISEAVGQNGKEAVLCVAIDKLDKIGAEKVKEELRGNGFPEESLLALEPLLSFAPKNIEEALAFISGFLAQSEIGMKGIQEIRQVLQLKDDCAPGNRIPVELDITLARGLSYYTGAIFEVKVNNVQMGSISGGGRYDNLTGVFGLPDVSGVGFSFGVDRLYDVMEELKLFPADGLAGTKVLFCVFDDASFKYSLPLAGQLRALGIATEVYPEPVKMKKQMGYADKKGIKYVCLAGSEEIESSTISIKNLQNGTQERVPVEGFALKVLTMLNE